MSKLAEKIRKITLSMNEFAKFPKKYICKYVNISNGKEATVNRALDGSTCPS
jgi:hypothetical protein